MKKDFRIRSAEILCVGNEVLVGDVVNTNAAFLSRMLQEMGIAHFHQEVVSDDGEEVSRYLSQAFGRTDLVIMTGGLGPTYDDLTKESVAALFGKKLVLHQPSLDRIASYFRDRRIPMTDNNRKQALMPEGCTVLPNDVGTAPGMAIEDEERGKIAILLPGPPREMRPMFLEKAVPYLKQYLSSVFLTRNVNLFGMGESKVAMILDDLMHSTNPSVATYVTEGEVRIRISAKGNNEEECETLCEKALAAIRESEVGQYIYGYDTDLETALVSLLKDNHLKVASAESCTGGMVSQLITSVPGSSEVFDGGIVSYANEIKSRLLGVSEKTLAEKGAVSPETAMEMAEGVRKLMRADVAVSLSGIAGPGGGTEEKPVGLVFLGVSTEKGSYAKELRIRNNGRDYIRICASKNALCAALTEAKRLSESGKGKQKND